MLRRKPMVRVRTLHCVRALACAAVLLPACAALALPPASGSKCRASWVNNEAAMACFVQGEEELRSGAAHPHYVACTAAGEIFCCVDNASGQDCEAVSSIHVGGHGRPSVDAVRLRATLEFQRTVSTLLAELSANVEKLTGSMVTRSAGGTTGAPSGGAHGADEAAVRAASAEWARVAAAKDLDKTLSYYAEDAAMFPPNMAVATGAQARRTVWSGAFALRDFAFSSAASSIEVARSGDLAYETGTYRQSFTDDKGRSVETPGKYVVVWKKQPGGQWKAIVDIFNSDR